MSWTGFKKAVNRAGAQVILKSNKNYESVDVEFDDIEKRFKTFESLIVELNSELESYKSIFNDLIECQFKIIKTFDSFFGNYDFNSNRDIRETTVDETENDKNVRDGISLQLLKNLNEIRTNICPALSNPLDVTVFQPIRELNDYNLEINKLIKKRGRKKIDYDISKSKFEKLQNDYNSLEFTLRENQNNVNLNALDKLNEKLRKSKADFTTFNDVYNELNNRLKTEIDQYISLRFSLLDRSFESFIKIQLKSFTDIKSLFERDINIDSMTENDYISGNLDNRLDDILVKMKALDIHNI